MALSDDILPLWDRMSGWALCLLTVCIDALPSNALEATSTGSSGGVDNASYKQSWSRYNTASLFDADGET